MIYRWLRRLGRSRVLPAAERRHFLVVYSQIPKPLGLDDVGAYDIEIEHKGCPSHTYKIGPDITVGDYDCDEEYQLEYAGLEAFGDEIAGLAPGRYQFEAWLETYPGGPWGDTEYDAGLRLIGGNLAKEVTIFGPYTTPGESLRKR